MTESMARRGYVDVHHLVSLGWGVSMYAGAASALTGPMPVPYHASRRHLRRRKKTGLTPATAIWIRAGGLILPGDPAKHPQKRDIRFWRNTVCQNEIVRYFY